MGKNKTATATIVADETVHPDTTTATLPAEMPAPAAKPKLVLVKAEYSATDTILSVVANPKRPGTRCYTDFAAYKPGMSVLDYLAKSGIPRARASANLRWDLARGFITVGPAPQA